MKKNFTLLLLLFFIFQAHSLCQVLPNYEWGHCLGGTNNDYGMDLKQTADGGYITAGSTTSTTGDVTGNHGNSDIWVIKTFADGNIQWQKTFGGSFFENGYSIQITSDGGYVIAGSSSSNDGDATGHHGVAGLFSDDVWVIRLDVNGNLLWQKSLGGTQGEIAYCIQNTSDDGFILCGYSLSNDGDLTGNNGGADLWLVKLNSLGILQWQKNYGGKKFDLGQYVIQTADGGYAVAGYSFSNDNDVSGHHGDSSSSDAWILRLNATGDKIWSKSTGGSGTDIAYAMAENPGGSLIFSGFAFSDDGDVHGHHGQGDWWVVWVDINGNITQDKCYGGSGQESCNSLVKLADGNYLLGGYNQSPDGDATTAYGFTDMWALCIDNSGGITWQQSYGSSDNEIGTHAILNSEGKLVMAGYTHSNNGEVFKNHGGYDYWLVKEGSPSNATNTSVTGSLFCPGSDLNATFTATGIFNAGNVFTAELSDFYGSFLNPVNIGSTIGTTGTTIHCKIPTIPDGYQYLVRVTSSDPVSYAIDNEAYLTIACPLPQNLSISNLSATSVKLEWQVTTACTVKYLLRYRAVNGGGWITVNNLSSPNYLLTNLTPSTTYMWSVKTKCKSPAAMSGFIDGGNFTTPSLKITGGQNSGQQVTVSPNPFSNNATVRFSLEENSNVKIELMTVWGEKIKMITERNFEAGINQVTLQKENLSAGIYLLQVISPAGTTTQKLIIQ